MLDDRWRVVPRRCVEPPRLVQRCDRQIAQFRQIAADELAVGVVVQRLLHRVVDPHGVDARHARLHLELAVVDTGLVVGEKLREDRSRPTPIEPKMVTGERDQHGTHAERDPAVRVQRAHAGVDERIAGTAVTPRVEELFTVVGLAHTLERRMHAAELDRRLLLEFLHEMATPREPRAEGLQLTRPVRRAGITRTLQRIDARRCRLIDLAHRERAVGDVRAQP